MNQSYLTVLSNKPIRMTKNTTSLLLQFLLPTPNGMTLEQKVVSLYSM